MSRLMILAFCCLLCLTGQEQPGKRVLIRSFMTNQFRNQYQHLYFLKFYNHLTAHLRQKERSASLQKSWAVYAFLDCYPSDHSRDQVIVKLLRRNKELASQECGLTDPKAVGGCASKVSTDFWKHIERHDNP